MSDVHNPEVRSKNMRAIRSANTKPELLVRKALHASGLRYRLGGAGLPGKPDLVFPRYRTAIFVHGCFWHQHAKCKYATMPKTNTEFWRKKFEANAARDARAASLLATGGWHVLTVWECDIGPDRLYQLLSEIKGHAATSKGFA